MIIDYSTARPTMAQLKAAGVTAVGRYIGWDSVPGYSSIGKNLTTAEAGELHAAGIATFLAFEYAADAPSHGAAQGTADGRLATAQLASLGAPLGTGVYYAADWDVPDYAPHLPDTPVNALAKLGPVGKYWQAIHATKPSHLVGGYGGYYVIKRLFDANLITLGWQTVAWSGGQRDPRAQLYQTTASVPIGGADYDIHEGAAADFGQWAPPAHPVLEQGMTGPAVTTLQQALNTHGYHLTVDGAFGPATKAAVISFQKQHGLAADGIVGPLTWKAL